MSINIEYRAYMQAADDAQNGAVGRVKGSPTHRTSENEYPSMIDAQARSEPKSVSVTVPMDPPSSLMPNQASKQAHWRTRSEWRKTCRDTAAYAAMEHVTGPPIAGPVSVTIHAAYGVDTQSRAKTPRMRTLPDLDATCAAVKPMIDGLAVAGLIVDDDQVVKLTATHERLPYTKHDRPYGYTIITIQEAPE